MFVAISGTQSDGARYALDAAKRGAVAMVSESIIEPEDLLEGKGLALIRVEDARNALAIIAARFYEHPSRSVKLIGVTGTNGKTTVTYLLESILNGNGFSVGVIGTVDYRYGGQAFTAGMTTPESVDINRMLSEMNGMGVSHCMLEVSSHALTFQRIKGLEFGVTVFTNLSQDHLDFHGTLEDYMLSKKSLFRDYPQDQRVVNVDDLLGREIFEEVPENTMTVGIHENADVRAENIRLERTGSYFNLKAPCGVLPVRSSLLGKHNVYNILSAAGAALQLGISLDDIVSGINALGAVPGRFEKVDCGQDFTVVVDYAHTEDAMSNILRAARSFTEGRILTVFGCGGDRDRGKRPKMGRVAVEASDFAVVTSDNPRSEDPGKIIEDIREGIPAYCGENERYVCVPERSEAIRLAIDRAGSGDFVIIAGKGHEDYQILNAETIHFDDREVAEKALRVRLSLD